MSGVGDITEEEYTRQEARSSRRARYPARREEMARQAAADAVKTTRTATSGSTPVTAVMGAQQRVRLALEPARDPFGEKAASANHDLRAPPLHIAQKRPVTS